MSSHDSAANWFQEQWWDNLLKLKCEDFDSFPTYYNNFNIALLRLEHLRSKVVHQDFLSVAIITWGVLADELQSSLDRSRNKKKLGIHETLNELFSHHKTLAQKRDLRNSKSKSSLTSRCLDASGQIHKKKNKPVDTSKKKVTMVVSEEKPAVGSAKFWAFPPNNGKFVPLDYGQIRRWYN